MFGKKTFALALLFVFLAASFAYGAPVVLKLSNVLPDGNPTTESMVFFAEKVMEKTGGTVEVRLFNNSALGGQREALESLQAGTIEMCMANAGPMAQFVPAMDVLSLPYVFQSTEHMFKALNGKAGEMIKADIEKAGFVFLYWGDGGSRNLINNKRPITKPEDLKGLKIRVMDSKLMVNTLNAMGAIATPMAQGEVYSALQQGVLDGWENNPVTLLTLKLYEVSDIFSWTQHFMVPDLVLISKQAFGKLTPEQQKAIVEAGREAEAKQREYWNAFVGKTVEELKAHNVKFNEVDVAPFVKAVQPVWEDYRAKFGTELLDLIIAANN
jgi:tripartite ATP-independent transporter DctP family solute receptor